MAARLRELMQLPGNTHCADCSANRPRYASVTLLQCVGSTHSGVQLTFGIFICDECFGSHRNAGTHVSRTRSVALDQVLCAPLSLHILVSRLCQWTEADVTAMERGNNASNAEFEVLDATQPSLLSLLYY